MSNLTIEAVVDVIRFTWQMANESNKRSDWMEVYSKLDTLFWFIWEVDSSADALRDDIKFLRTFALTHA